MAQASNIEWTDATWNPTRGCTKVSKGCEHCYAMSVAYRFSGAGQPYRDLAVLGSGNRPQWTNKVVTVPEKMLEPLSWRKPRRVFVNSMSDLFHDQIPDSFIWRVFAVMAAAGISSKSTFQVLTKRPERMQKMLSDEDALANICTAAEWIAGDQGWCHLGENDFTWPLPNVWLGVSVEDQPTADARIPLLLKTPAAIRFISAEPLLGPIDLMHIHLRPHRTRAGYELWTDALSGAAFAADSQGEVDTECERIDWVIVGGESGKDARPMHIAWVRTISDQIDYVNAAWKGSRPPVAFFLKQWGEWAPSAYTPMEAQRTPAERAAGYLPGVMHDWGDGYLSLRIGKKSAGREFGGRTWDQFPAAAEVAAP